MCRSAYREPSFGHGMLELQNATHATWTWNRNQDGAQQVADQVTLARDTAACANRAGSAPAPQAAIAAVSG